MILFPYAHEKQTVQRLPYVTFGLIALNVIIFLLTHYSKVSMEKYFEKKQELMEYVYQHAYLELKPEGRKHFEDWQLEDLDTMREAMKTPDSDPSEIVDEQRYLDRLIEEVNSLEKSNPIQKYGYVPSEGSFKTLITCMFLHGGWLHLLGNMFFLYLAGCSIEDVWGRPLYIIFYLISGIVATMIHVVKFPQSTEPLLGASGAIAGLMGAFLVRLWDTRISFFYMLGFWYRGTFQAPAYIMLPLWLFQQIFYAMLDKSGEQGVAFWAHIGGFVFGAMFAFVMKQTKLEEKHIAPKIEKKVSLEQNPDFLRAMELSEQGSFPEASILLHKVVKADSAHQDALMELKRIAEITDDSETYNKCVGTMLENLVRAREHDLLLQLYESYTQSPLKKVLPAKALFAMAGFFEEIQDYPVASDLFNEIADGYPNDPLALKALSKVYRMNFEKLKNREKGINAFWRAYDHPSIDDQWRKAILADQKRYDIPPRTSSSLQTEPEASPAPSFAAPVPAVAQAVSFAAPVVIQPQQPRPGPKSPVQASPAGVRLDLPHVAFDALGDGASQVIHCRLEKLVLKGLELINQNQSPGFLGWKRIQTVSVGRIRMMNPATSKPDEDYLVVDLICSDPGQNGSALSYRLFSHEIKFNQIFPRVEQSFEDAYQNFLGILLTNSEAKCIPNRDSCMGPNFAVYPELARYDLRLKEKLRI